MGNRLQNQPKNEGQKIFWEEIKDAINATLRIEVYSIIDTKG